MKIVKIWRTVQTTGSSPTVVLTKYHVKTSWQERFAAVLNEYSISCLSAPGNIMAEAYYENGDPFTMWTMERWKTRAFYSNNKRSVAAKAVNALIKTGLASPVETTFIKVLELISNEVPGNDSATGDQPVTIMLTIDVQTGAEDGFKSINRDLVLALRNEPGILVFQFGQILHHKTGFIIWKKFLNWNMFQYHLKEPALEPVMKFLQDFVKEPPFEKGYHHLIKFAPL